MLRLAVVAAVLCLAGCDRRPKRSSTSATDAGPRAVTVKLGSPVTEMEGDVWARSQGRTLTEHEIKGPVVLTVVLPESGRRFTLSSKKALGTTDDHHWPGPNDPPEVSPPRVELITFEFGRFPTYFDALDEANRQLARAGVDPASIEAMDRKRRERPAPFAVYPLEGCVYAEASLMEVGRETHLSIEIGLRSNCPADAGR